MRRKLLISIRLLLLVGLLLALALPLDAAHADVGPKPTADFTLFFEGPPQAVVAAQLYDCADAACNRATRRPMVEPGLYCNVQTCSTFYYGVAEYQVLAITFANGAANDVQESDPFTKRFFNSEYQVMVTAGTGLGSSTVGRLLW